MRLLSFAILFLLLFSCDKGKQENNEETQYPYWGDSVEIWVSSSTNGSTSFNLRGLKTDSVCLYFQYSDSETKTGELTTSCRNFDPQSSANMTRAFGLEGVNVFINRSLRLDYYAIAWIDGEPYRSKDQWTYGGFETHFNDDTLYQYDSTRPLVFPESLECNQAIALFHNESAVFKKEYWTNGVKCLGNMDRTCLSDDWSDLLDPYTCVIEFEGTYNDAATQLERNAPSDFITLYPWCEGLKRCSGTLPPT